MSLILVLYLWRILLFRTCGVLFLLVTVYASIDLVEAGARIPVSPATIFFAYAYKLPVVISHVLPLALTTGALLTLSVLRRRGEWTAMQVSGTTPMVPLVAIVAIPALCTLPAYFLIHLAAPSGMAEFERATGQDYSVSSPLYQNGSTIVSRKSGSRSSTVVLEREGGEATKLVVVDDDTGTTGSRWDKDAGWGHHGNQRAKIPKGVDMLKPAANGLIGESESTAELRGQMRALESRGLDSRGVGAQIGLRNALVVSCLIVPLMALFIAGTLPSNKSSFAVVLALVTCGIYWALLVTAWTSANAGIAPVWFVLYGVCGLWGVLLLVVGARFIIRPLPY